MNSKKTQTSAETDILEAAKRIFQLKGMEGARMQEIADEAGINKALLHYYYRSKQLLFEAVFKNAFMLLAPQLNKVLNDDSSLFDKITNFSHNYISFVVKHPYLPNFIIQELNRNPEFILKLTSDKHFPSIGKFKKQVEENVVAKIIRPIKPEQLFINLFALNIFPFIASPLLKGFLGINNCDFNDLIEERKTEVASFIINAIKV
ncbi:TetR/AcrR family transcriptional regulator [Lutibacter sp. HS1-25]|uniref:TetR/AcrR family transcriptional regulator n=1 Tax=Lutibacter sp. HS1-25 TaxID=2485000 RepID=UPI00101348EA|nr:TetR/AcrR family transcriptional regulator [Lutibacter sp. HS1-25]RXP59437.1 TetR/AcrR family transcriptional regulator [Lutibacter sp. HS1-25]